MSRKKSIERSEFWEGFGLLVSDGYPLIQVLDGAAEKADEKLREVIPDIKDSFQNGSSFSDAMVEHRDAFSEFEIVMVRAGEATGNLASIAERLAEIAAEMEA